MDLRLNRELTSWNELAWNGVRFQAPTSLHPGQIGKRYLLLESDDRPALELRWEKVKGRFSHKANLKRLAGERNRRGIPEFKQIDLPESWKDALSAFDARGFAWRGRNLSGTGVLAYCSVCRTASLIQFYHYEDVAEETFAPRVLKSFQDHNDGELARFALFDIQTEIPAKYSLDWYGFDTGRFELGFTWRKRQFVLNRFAPASALLGREGLADFARRYLAVPAGDPVISDDLAISTAEWTVPAGGRLYQVLLRGLSIKSRVWRLRLAHDKASNRILAVRAQGPAPPLNGDFEWVANGFKVVPIE